jgi:hypothetical protein
MKQKQYPQIRRRGEWRQKILFFLPSWEPEGRAVCQERDDKAVAIEQGALERRTYDLGLLDHPLTKVQYFCRRAKARSLVAHCHRARAQAGRRRGRCISNPGLAPRRGAPCPAPGCRSGP